jgi:hypothetical protein
MRVLPQAESKASLEYMVAIKLSTTPCKRRAVTQSQSLPCGVGGGLERAQLSGVFLLFLQNFMEPL